MAYWPFLAARYWGLTPSEYVERADVWPANPDGELLIMGIIESSLGVKNIERILDATNGLGIIWPGPGDMSTDMGLHLTSPPHPEVVENITHVREVCVSRGVPCATIASNIDEAVECVNQGFQVDPHPIPTRHGCRGPRPPGAAAAFGVTPNARDGQWRDAVRTLAVPAAGPGPTRIGDGLPAPLPYLGPSTRPVRSARRRP